MVGLAPFEKNTNSAQLAQLEKVAAWSRRASRLDETATSHAAGIRVESRFPRANGAATHQPRAASWEFGYPILQQP